MTTIRVERLPTGSLFKLVGLEHLGTYKLLRKSPTGATVRNTKQQEKEFETAAGELVTFKAPSRSELVGGTTLVSRARS